MKIMKLYTGGGVSLSPQDGEGRHLSDHVRLVSDEGMAITDGETVTVCVDTRHPEKWADCELPEMEV